MKLKVNQNPNITRLYMSITLIIIDIFTILLVFSSTTFFWNFIKKDIIYSKYEILIPFVLLFIATFAFMDLYPAIGMGPVTEFKAIYIATSLVFLLFGSLTFLTKVIDLYSRGIFILSWVFCLLLLPTMRSLCVKFLSKRGFWGDPVLVVGHNSHSKEIVKHLKEHPEYGLIPKVIMNYFPANPGRDYLGVPILNGKRNTMNRG